MLEVPSPVGYGWEIIPDELNGDSLDIKWMSCKSAPDEVSRIKTDTKWSPSLQIISFINCFFDRHFSCFLWRKKIINKKKKNKAKRCKRLKNITKSNDTLVKRLLMLKNELIFDIPMLCLYALWCRSYFNEIEEENLL